MDTTSIPIDRATHAAAKSYAQAHGLKLYRLAEMAVREYLAERGAWPPDSDQAPKDDAAVTRDGARRPQPSTR